MQSIKNTFDKLSDSINSNISKKSSIKKSPLETIINTPINSYINQSKSKKSFTIPSNYLESKTKSNKLFTTPLDILNSKSKSNKSFSIPLKSLTDKTKSNKSLFSNNYSDKISNKLDDFKSKTSSIAKKSFNISSQTFNFDFKNVLLVILSIVVLAFLGFNIFTYLSDGTNFITKMFGPVVSSTGDVIGDATKSTVDVTSVGTKKIVDTGSDTTKNIVDVANKGTTTGIDFLQNSLKKTTNIVNPENNNILTDDINKKIDKTDSPPEPIKTSSLQQGYCFIGKINDTRHCAKVNERTQCMSGDIYPTMDICVNPNLRA
tara:strand:- start:1369 stop:2322 length:954 start_codon:yes stop_codon:yes gene_type:complete